MDKTDDTIWDGDYKIPWHDPDFSRRMLNEHLSQDHDLASRRVEWIDRQVVWIHQGLLWGEASRILDLGCGPGFYLHRLGELGHYCCGIDFGPASIEYAQEQCPEDSPCDFCLGDLRHTEFAGPYDLVMMIYGELNVFSPAEALGILRKAQASLAPHGRLIAEIQTADAVERMGRSDASVRQYESGLFSDRLHSCRTESQWLDDQRVAVQTFNVIEVDGSQTNTYRSTTKVWTDDELVELLENAGFRDASQVEDWPCNNDDLQLWVAEKK
ncbi:MAG: methyltransferase domain-containing protein [Pirellulales bacterium]|nr:methyltransferase domain-containing protein [Pirellulales bacterium]